MSDVGRTLPRRARVIRDHVAQYPDAIRVRAGQVVRLDREDDQYPGWWWCTAPDGRSGWVPDELLLRRGVEADILEDYDATELAVRGGDEVCVSSISHEWLFVSNSAGATGWIPAACVAFEGDGLNGTLEKGRT